MTIINLFDGRFTISAHKAELIVWVSACLLMIFGKILITGSGTCLGKAYGKTNYFIATCKYLSIALSFLLIFVFMFVWTVDFVMTFLKSSLWNVLGFAIALIIYFGLYFISKGWENAGVARLERRCSEEINLILMDNPIFSTILKELESNTSWKSVCVYRDGVALYKNRISPSSPVKIDVSRGASSNSEAQSLLKSMAFQWLATEGRVENSKGEYILRYADYNYANSENAMADIARHLKRLLQPRFEIYKTERTWNYHGIESSSTGSYTVLNGRVTKNTSSKTIHAFDAATANYILVTPQEQLPPKHDSPKLNTW